MAVALLLLLTLIVVCAVPGPSVEQHRFPNAKGEAPLCSSGISDQPCRIDDVCSRIENREILCKTRVDIYASTENSWISFSPPMDLSISILEEADRRLLYFVNAAVNIKAPEIVDQSMELSQVHMSLPMTYDVVDLLNDLHYLESSLICVVNSSGVFVAPNSNSFLLQPNILWSSDWKITSFKAECNDPNIIISSWNVLKNKFHLTHLALQKCNLNGEVYLKRQSHLQSLELQSCSLLDLPDNFFEETPNIHSLTLANNNLTKLPQSISNLKRLQELDLSGNLLLPSDNLYSILLSLTNLQKLHLSRTHISSLFQLEPILNSSLVQLTVLHLSECQLTFVHEDDINLLSKQIHLKILDLSKNYISYISSNWSNLQTNIKILNLSSNFLTTVQFRFPSEIEFKVIDISFNKLSKIGNILLSGRTEYLNISHNTINTINGLDYSNTINHLNLSFNSIENLTENNILSMSSLQSIDLGGNIFNCGICSITILQNWITGNHTVKILAFNSTHDLLCAASRYSSLKIVDVKQEKCKDDDLTRNPEWARVFTISLVLSLIFLTVVLLRGYQFETCFLMRLWRNNNIDDSTRDSFNFQYDAFVCYSNTDREWVVNNLMNILEAAPHFYKLCDHERDFILGSLISQNVLQSMQLSRHIIFILSESFLNSQWCVWELEMARHKEFEEGGNSPILLELVPLDHSALSDGIASLLNGPNFLDDPDDTHFWDKLVNLLGPSLASIL